MFCSTPTVRPEALVDRAHPLGVAAGEVVVDRDDVDALAGERVEHDGERAGERLALAGAHLGDRAAVQHHAADHLDVEVAHAHAPARDLAHDREGLRQQVVERLAVAGALAQRVGLRAQLVVVEQLELRLPRVDGVDALRVALELLGLAHPQGAIEDRHALKDRGWRWPSRARSDGRAGCPERPGPASGCGRRRLRGGALLAAPAALVAVALDLARELVRDQVDRVLDVARGVRRAQRDALEVQGRLGHLALGVRGVALLARARPRARPAR